MWKYQNNALDKEQLQINESLFTLANGYLGVRGCFEEGYHTDVDSIRGTYINGLYDTLPVSHPEKLYGFPEFQDKQPNLVDLQSICVELDGEEVNLFSGAHSDYVRTLKLDEGYSERAYRYKTHTGKIGTVTFKRLVSFHTKELFVQNVTVEYEGKIKIQSVMNTDVTNYVNAEDPRVGSEHARLLNIKDVQIVDDCMTSAYETVHSHLLSACGSYHSANGCTDFALEMIKSQSCQCILYGEGSLNLTKYNVYTDQIRHSEPQKEVLTLLKKVSKQTFEELLDKQIQIVSGFWNLSDIEIKGNTEDQLAIRYNLFQLYQSVGRDMYSNISAKGLSGEGYEGHYFWDTEIYVLPTFQLNQNVISRNLLMYRYNQLDAARIRAKELGHKRGVKFPWRTISGIECSAYYPAGTAQYHINGDVAHAFIQNFIYTEELDFMRDYGAEVLFETALLWLDIGHMHKGQFKIDCVTGPDEYTAIVNNNYYTNALAKHNLEWAIKIYNQLLKYAPVELRELMVKLNVSDGDIKEIQQAAESMYLPHDDGLGIDMQDDGFLSKKMWDFDNTPKSHYPLLLHYHPLTIYRYQVLKQPDTVLAHFLLEEYTDEETMKKSYDYYEAITTHDSSLSPCVYGIMASRVGYKERAYGYFGESLKLDLENTHGNTKDGLHMANLAGTALSMLYGFAGLRVSEGGLSLRPWKPDVWDEFSFKVVFKKRVLRVVIGDSISIELIEGEPIDIRCYDKSYKIDKKFFLPLHG